MVIKSLIGLCFLLLANIQLVAQQDQSVAGPQQNNSSGQIVPAYDEIEPLLIRNTCVACHLVKQRILGPSFAEIAARNYSEEHIVQLIYNPQPSNWPDIATPMAPMPQVPPAEAHKIALWINSLLEE